MSQDKKHSKESSLVETVEEQMTDALDEVQSALKKGSKTAMKTLKQYPLHSALAGLGVGFVLGVLLSRRK